MQFFTLAATTLFTGLAMAAPASEAEARSLSATIKFEGAADAAYTITVPVDGQYHETCKCQITVTNSSPHYDFLFLNMHRGGKTYPLLSPLSLFMNLSPTD